VTIHRDINTDDILRLNTILTTLLNLAEESKLVFVMPLHPRTSLSLKNNLEELLNKLNKSKYIRIIPPVSFLEMTFLEMTSRMIITDSGGVQKESHFFKKPCIVLRKETEWVELIKNGTAMLADADPALITAAFNFYLNKSLDLEYPAFYGDGKTAEFILKEVLMMFE
ncbi:MAG TPA: UDP-N-acetylglucosamine 2-epimerase (non-hydrolyzing), partial [Bacteroidetes bacterium]|nr:UDP-N-acetylglucosamine 2-epimerase (non-hydrolyzing) [Bacteroidota bacterium]HRC90250.1 UDP-N-acetylglucosamine 2-epimerase [Bacteroidales bacterium]